jgi:hypothetical protein
MIGQGSKVSHKTAPDSEGEVLHVENVRGLSRVFVVRWSKRPNSLLAPPLEFADFEGYTIDELLEK